MVCNSHDLNLVHNLLLFKYENCQIAKVPFVSGWETGVDGTLEPPRVVFNIKNAFSKKEANVLNTSSVKRKQFVFIHSLPADSYIRLYCNENSYVANLYKTTQHSSSPMLYKTPTNSHQFPVSIPSKFASHGISSNPYISINDITEQLNGSISMFDSIWSISQKLDSDDNSSGLFQGSNYTLQPLSDNRKQGNFELDSLSNEQTDDKIDLQVDTQYESINLVTEFDSETTRRGNKPRATTADRTNLRDFTCSQFPNALIRRLQHLVNVSDTVDGNGHRSLRSDCVRTPPTLSATGLEVTGVATRRKRPPPAPVRHQPRLGYRSTSAQLDEKWYHLSNR